MKSRFAKGTPEYRDELRREALWLLAGLAVGFALAINVHITPKKPIQNGTEIICGRTTCML